MDSTVASNTDAALVRRLHVLYTPETHWHASAARG